MKIYERHGVLKARKRLIPPRRIILHHTAGGSRGGAVAALKKRGLGYHYIVDKNGSVHEYVSPRYKVYHAYRKNTGTIGISFVGGGKYGPCNENQLNSIVMLIRKLKREYPGIKDFTGHKHVDPRGWKIDPHFMGEPKAGVDWDIDRKYMKKIEKMSGLKAALLRPKRK